MIKPDRKIIILAVPVLMGFFGSFSTALSSFASPAMSGEETSADTSGQETKDAQMPASETSAPRVKSLTAEEQAKFLQMRLPGNVIGNLGSFASLLYAMEGTVIGSSSTAVLHRPLHTIYPHKDVYMPTYAEFFDMIGRETGTSYRYEPEVNVWLFNEPAMPPPFALTKSSGWTSEDRGQYVAFIPQIAPVGMDIYMMGRYSDITPLQSAKIRDMVALQFSKMIDAKSTIEEMKPVTVDGAEAMYYETSAPEADRLWRQWAFLKNGQAFVIVSAFSKENKDKIVPAVDAMVKSFHVTDKDLISQSRAY